MINSVLILGGTADARALADALAARYPDTRVISSLAGRTASPRLPKGEVLTGGFGGPDGLAAYLREEGIGALVDATHPFAEEISRNAATAAENAGVPRLVLARLPWIFVRNAALQHARSITAAKSALETGSKRVFLAIGRQEVNEFSELDDLFFLLRFVDPPQERLRFAQHHVLTGRPGTPQQERKILEDFAIDTLVAKNGGSAASRAKVDAALEMGIRVILIDPPPPPPPPHAENVETAVIWLEAL